MKTLDDLPPIIKKLLLSSNEEDLRIGVEFLKKEKLSDKEYLYILPDIIVGDPLRDIKSEHRPSAPLIIKIKNKLVFVCNESGWLVITAKW